MSSRLLILDIAGSLTALASSSRAVAQWATTVSPVILQGEIPSGITISVDPETGESDAGGMSLRTRDISALLNDVGVTKQTNLDGDHTAVATVINLDSVAGLPASGNVWIGQECISYAAIVASTLDPATRGALGTYALPHYDGDEVFASNPNILGRRCELSWQDARVPATGTAWTRFVGFIYSGGWADGAYTLRIISASKLATDQKVLTKQYVKGRLNREYPGALGSLYIDHLADDGWDANLTTTGCGYLRIDDEILKFYNLVSPSDTETILSFTTPDQLFVKFPEKFRSGQKLDVTDSVGAMKQRGVTVFEVFESTAAASYIRVHGLVGHAHAAGDLLVANYTTVMFNNYLERGALDTVKADHDIGAEVTEVRVLEGNLVEAVLLPLMVSVLGTGLHGPASGGYDILPSGWGGGIDESFLDYAALQTLSTSGRAAARRYVFTDSVSLSDLLKWVAQTTNSSIFWTEAGKLSVIVREDLYPGTTVDHSLDNTWHKEKAIPSAEIRTDKLYNTVNVKTDFRPTSGESTHSLIIEVLPYVRRYGRRVLEISDSGIQRSKAEAELVQAMYGWLYYRGLPYPEVTLPVRLAESTTYHPGQLVAVTIPHLPNMEGSTGLSGTWEIIEVSPSDAQGQVDLRIIYRGLAPRVGHVAPSGIVLSADVPTKTIILALAATTQMAQSAAYGGSVPAFEQDGTEDSDWFIEGDILLLWDTSTLGAANTTAQAVITSINYATREFTLDAIPAWIAAGDLVRFIDYATFAAGATAAQREDIYLALADSTASPPDLGAGDDAYLYGM